MLQIPVHEHDSNTYLKNRMPEHNPQDRPRRRTRSALKTFIYGFITVFIFSAIGVSLYFRQMPPGPEALLPSKGTVTSPGNLHDSAGQPTSPGQQPGDSGTVSSGSPQQPGNIPLPADMGSSRQRGETPHEEESLDSSSAESPTGAQRQPAATVDKQRLIEELNTFYSHLDQEPYMQAFGLKEPSKVHFSRLLQKLIDNPPVVTRETDDLFTLLKNTAHFFRILDQENITILKGILDREKKSFEQILKTFYTLTYYPEILQKEYSLNIQPDALHDYAGFFLNTIGGRLYLFRRDSASRMTVSYYAILVIDRANSEGGGRHGIDLRPAIDSLIEEIENTGKNLRFKEEYLDTLYDLKEKYN